MNEPDEQPDEFRERYTKKKSFRQAYAEEFQADGAKDSVFEVFELAAEEIASNLVKLALTAPSDGIRLKASMYVTDKITAKTVDDEDHMKKLFKEMNANADT